MSGHGARGGFYDRFRNRIVFPIFDIKTRVLGFGARALGGDDKAGAKYINSICIHKDN